jgi:hypothetical protein
MIFVYGVFLVLRKRTRIKNPFQFGKQFWHNTKKWWLTYFINDAFLFLGESLLFLNPANSLTMRVIGFFVSLCIYGFFGWFRDYVMQHYMQRTFKRRWMKYFVGNTVSAFIFWTPMYLWRIAIFVIFGLESIKALPYGLIYAVISTVASAWFIGYIWDKLDLRLHRGRR